MLHLSDLLLFYRIKGVNKISGFRSMAYLLVILFFSWIFVGEVNLNMFIFYSGIYFFVLLFSFAVNDFFDYLIQREKTGIGILLEEKRISFFQAFVLTFLPLLVVIPSFFLDKTYFLTSIVGVVASFAYSAPPFRLSSKWYRFIVVPFFLGFLAPWTLINILGLGVTEVFCLLFLILFYQIYCEVIHISSDNDVPAKNWGRKKMFLLAGGIQFFLGISAVLFGFFVHPIFFASAFLSSIRLFSMNSLGWKKWGKELSVLRKNVFNGIYSFHDFAFYSLSGIFFMLFRILG